MKLKVVLAAVLLAIGQTPLFCGGYGSGMNNGDTALKIAAGAAMAGFGGAVLYCLTGILEENAWIGCDESAMSVSRPLDQEHIRRQHSTQSQIDVRNTSEKAGLGVRKKRRSEYFRKMGWALFGFAGSSFVFWLSFQKNRFLFLK